MRRKARENENLVIRWYERAAEGPGREAIVHWRAGQAPVRWPFSSLLRTAERYALSFQGRGIRSGEVCAIIVKHSSEFYPAYLGVSILGSIPAVLAYPNARLHPEKFAQGIRGMVQHSGLDWIITEPSLHSTLASLIESAGTGLKGIVFMPEGSELPEAQPEDRTRLMDLARQIRPGDPAVLQHSSGTTGLQKPVLLTHRVILDHVENYAEALRLNAEDKVVSWLPLYHDMGLIAAFHLPLALGIPSVQIDPFEWVLAPSLLFEAVSGERGTLAWMPNFAFNLCAQKIHDDEMRALSLETLRMVINCSEPVRQESHEAFLRRFKKYGLRESAISTAYAMAETTFAATQTPPGKSPAFIRADRKALARGKVKAGKDPSSAKVCVSSGRPLRGCLLKSASPKGKKLPDGRIGELWVKSPSVFEGYRNYPEKTREVLKNGWYRTGDMGFLSGGECFVTGRKKDLIITGGQNIYPEDIEAEVSRVSGVIPGRVIAFGEEDAELGTEQACVLAETNLRHKAGREDLRRRIVEAALGIDVTLKKVYLVPARWIIKSSSGKASRSANRERVGDSSAYG